MKLHRPAKAFLSLALASMFAVSMVGCSSSKPAETTKPAEATKTEAKAEAPKPAEPAKPVKIGVFFSVTGGASSLGKGEMDTVKMLAEQINAKGGIKGAKIELVEVDDKSLETEAVLAVKKLIQEGVVGIVGGTTSGNTLAVIDTIQKEQMPFISAAASIAIVKPVKEWVFKTPQSDEQAIIKILEHTKAKGWTKLGWININNAYGDSGRAEFERLSKNYGVEIVASERYNPKDTDMTAQLTRIKGKNPQAVINWSTPPEASIVTRNFKQIGFSGPLYQSHGVANGAFLEQSGDAANGVILPAGYLLVADGLPDGPRKKVLVDYASQFKAKYGSDPNTFGGHAWDGFMMMVSAIENAGTDKAKIRDYLESGIKSFPGITGTFTMKKDDHMGLHNEDAFALIEIKGGKWTLLSK